MNPASTSPRNLIGLYSAWRLDDDEDLPHPTQCAPDLHIETRIATFIVEPGGTLELSAGMARREAFPLDDFETEELGTRFVDMFTIVKRVVQDRYFGFVPTLDYDWYLRNA